jgi:hypothetical protein
MLAFPGMHYIVVIEEEASGSLVAAGTVLVERKFIHSAGSVRVYVYL